LPQQEIHLYAELAVEVEQTLMYQQDSIFSL